MYWVGVAVGADSITVERLDILFAYDAEVGIGDVPKVVIEGIAHHVMCVTSGGANDMRAGKRVEASGFHLVATFTAILSVDYAGGVIEEGDPKPQSDCVVECGVAKLSHRVVR